MAKDILEILICLIGYICEKTESCYICKALVIESADVTVIKFLFHDHGSGICHAFRHKETVCKVVGASCRNVSDGNGTLLFHYSGNHLIKSPVSAATYDKVHFGFVFFGFLIGIFWFLCGIDNDFITTFVENIYYIKQVCFDLAFACLGIENKEHFFVHFEQLSFFQGLNA